MTVSKLSLPAIPLLLSLGACAAQASVTVRGSDDAQTTLAAEGSASTSISGDGEQAPLRARIRLHMEGDELVQEGGEINFAYDAATLEGEATFATLQTYADLLTRYPKVTIRLEGHTDSRGADSRNRELSQRRAEAVRDWLIEHGIAAERLEAVGLGESRPKVAEPPECHNKKAATAPEWCDAKVWTANRRSEFHVVEGAETLPDGELTGVVARTERVSEPVSVADASAGSGAYIYGSPGLLSVTLGSRDEVLARGASYRWGVGAGYLWRRDKLAIGLGLGLSHVPVNVDTRSDRCDGIGCQSAHDLLLDLELRIGGGSPKLIGYALLAPGLALGISRTDGGRFVTPGFGLDFGGGLWGRVWRGLFVGGEVVITPSIYASDPDSFHSSSTVAGLGVRAMLGWQFGWRRADAKLSTTAR
jgi:outer membrane protein OmpA-like peptidoglycan-associated protein